MKTRNTILSLLVVLGVLLSACGGPVATTAAPQPTQPAAQPTTPPQPTEEVMEPVTITIWHGWAGDYVNVIQEAFDGYTELHPNVTIELSHPDDLSEAAKVAIPAGEGPDIFAWVNDAIGTQALAGNIVSLDDQGIDQAFLESTYEPAAVNGVIWQGQIWGLPETQEGIALVYNKELVTEEYLPSDPLDFADLLAKAEQFKADTGLPLLCNQGFPGADAYHVAPIYFGFGVPSYVNDEGIVSLNTPEGVAAGQWLLDVKQFVDAEQSYDICNAAMAEGKIGMWWTGPWAIANLETAGVDFGIAPMGRPFVGIKTLMLTPNAVDRGNAEVALDVMKYFTSAEVQAQLALANKTIPAATEALNDPEVQALASLAGFGAALNLGSPMANTPFASAQWQPVGDATAAIWNGAQTPEEALAAAQATIEEAIAQMK